MSHRVFETALVQVLDVKTEPYGNGARLASTQVLLSNRKLMTSGMIVSDPLVTRALREYRLAVRGLIIMVQSTSAVRSTILS